MAWNIWVVTKMYPDLVIKAFRVPIVVAIACPFVSVHAEIAGGLHCKTDQKEDKAL